MHPLKALLAASLLFMASVAFAQSPGQADSALAAALDEQGIIYSVNDEGNYVVIFQMDADEERSQRVFVVTQTSTYRNAELREIWSVAVVLNEYPEIGRASCRARV